MIFWILNKELVNLDGVYTGSAALLIAASTYLRNLITVTKDTQTGKFILTISVKGTVCVILSEPPWKDCNAWYTTIHWNFNTVVFLTLNVFTSASFSIASFLQEMRISLSQRTHKWNLQKQITLMYILCLIRQSFSGYRCKSGIAIYGGSHKLQLIVPLNY